VNLQDPGVGPKVFNHPKVALKQVCDTELNTQSSVHSECIVT
jgi:hypothetical protein